MLVLPEHVHKILVVKKVILLFVVAFFITCSIISCGQKEDINESEADNNESIVDGESETMIELETGIYYNKNWDASEGTYYGDAVPNEKVAVEIASSIFEAFMSEFEHNYVPQRVFYDVEEDIWIISFWEPIIPNKDGSVTIGSSYTIAIRKKDGKVMRIWARE